MGYDIRDYRLEADTDELEIVTRRVIEHLRLDILSELRFTIAMLAMLKWLIAEQREYLLELIL